MDIPKRISHVAEKPKGDKRSNRITVRDFLARFGVERRGSNTVQEIRAVLGELELETVSDFEGAWIDAPIGLFLKPGVISTCPTNLRDQCGSESEDEEPEGLGLEGWLAAVKSAEERSASALT